MKLENLPKKTGLKVPENDYFTNLPTQIQAKAQAKTKTLWLGFGLQKWAYACSFLLASAVWWGVSEQFSEENIPKESITLLNNSSEVLTDFSDDFLDEYLLESDISTEELFATLHQGENQSQIIQDLKIEILEGLEDEEIIMEDINAYLLN